MDDSLTFCVKSYFLIAIKSCGKNVRMSILHHTIIYDYMQKRKTYLRGVIEYFSLPLYGAVILCVCVCFVVVVVIIILQDLQDNISSSKGSCSTKFSSRTSVGCFILETLVNSAII